NRQTAAVENTAAKEEARDRVEATIGHRHAVERQSARIRDGRAIGIGHLPFRDGQSREVDRGSTGDVKDAAGVVAADGQEVRARPVDGELYLRYRIDGELATREGDDRRAT